MQCYSTEAVQKVSEQIAALCKPPLLANLHWDGKFMQTLDASSTVELLPILLSETETVAQNTLKKYCRWLTAVEFALTGTCINAFEFSLKELINLVLHYYILEVICSPEIYS